MMELKFNGRATCRRAMSLVLFCMIHAWAFAQNTELTGEVADRGGNPVAGVTVMEKGTNNAALTDDKGIFSIRLRSNPATLVFSSLGYKRQEIQVTATDRRMAVVLEDDIAGLDEVVVIGYGTQRKGEVTRAVVRVKSEDFLA